MTISLSTGQLHSIFYNIYTSPACKEQEGEDKRRSFAQHILFELPALIQSQDSGCIYIVVVSGQVSILPLSIQLGKAELAPMTDPARRFGPVASKPASQQYKGQAQLVTREEGEMQQQQSRASIHLAARRNKEQGSSSSNSEREKGMYACKHVLPRTWCSAATKGRHTETSGGAQINLVPLNMNIEIEI